MTKYLVTGATGQLGQYVIEALDAKGIANSDVAVLVRSDDSVETFTAKGYDARQGDYNDLATLEAAFAGVDRLLLISSSEIGQRVAQHENAIKAAQAAGVKFIAYTSILRADQSEMMLAQEHKATEAILAETAIPSAILRNGWYTENPFMALPQILEMGQHFGAAGQGKFSFATREDYAHAAAAVLTGEGHEGKVYELGGDVAHSLADFAATVGELTGKDIAYVDMPEADYKAALLGAGLPEPLAALLAGSDAQAAKGWLETRSKDLSKLIGRPTTPLKVALGSALANAA